MNGEWTNKLSALVKSVGNFAKTNKPVANAFHNLEVATRENKVLDAKTHELISLAVAVTTRCDGCLTAHAAAAKSWGNKRRSRCCIGNCNCFKCWSSLCLLGKNLRRL